MADFWTNFLAALWADFIVAYLFILNHDKVICDSSFPSNFIFKWQETKASTFFLLLIVHYDNFTDFTVVWKETAQIRLCDGWWKTTQKYLKIKYLFIILFVCLFLRTVFSIEKFKFSQILLDDKNATSLCSKNISTLIKLREFVFPFLCPIHAKGVSACKPHVVFVVIHVHT